jgi:hypothetical protein
VHRLWVLECVEGFEISLSVAGCEGRVSRFVHLDYYLFKASFLSTSPKLGVTFSVAGIGKPSTSILFIFYRETRDENARSLPIVLGSFMDRVTS